MWELLEAGLIGWSWPRTWLSLPWEARGWALGVGLAAEPVAGQVLELQLEGLQVGLAEVPVPMLVGWALERALE